MKPKTAVITAFLALLVVAAVPAGGFVTTTISDACLRPKQQLISTSRFASININTDEDKISAAEKHFLETSLFTSTPFLAAIASYFLYPTTSRIFHQTVLFLSNNKWVPVDGGNLQWSILLPALNGVVMTAISLLYANLISTTGTQLRERQLIIHKSLSTEVDGIRKLVQLIPFYPEDCRQQFGEHVEDYVHMIVQELAPDVDSLSLRSAYSPLMDYRQELHGLSVSASHTLDATIRERSYETLEGIATGRAARIASLQTTFPPLHYVTISTLTAVILLVFLIETDRDVILFLDNFQLRLVWGLLVGTLTAIFCIGIDLTYPFIGTYTVPAEQLLEDNDELIRLIGEAYVTTGSTRRRHIAEEGNEQWEDGAFPILHNEQAVSTALDTGQLEDRHSTMDDHVTRISDEPPTTFEEYMRRRSMGEY